MVYAGRFILRYNACPLAGTKHQLEVPRLALVCHIDEPVRLLLLRSAPCNPKSGMTANVEKPAKQRASLAAAGRDPYMYALVQGSHIRGSVSIAAVRLPYHQRRLLPRDVDHLHTIPLGIQAAGVHACV